MYVFVFQTDVHVSCYFKTVYSCYFTHLDGAIIVTDLIFSHDVNEMMKNRTLSFILYYNTSLTQFFYNGNVIVHVTGMAAAF